MKFKQVEKTPQTNIEIADLVIDTTEIRGMQIGVFHNEDKLTARIQYKFDAMQAGWKSDDVSLTNDLYERRHIQYQMPSGFEFAQPWYTKAIDRAKEFSKKTKSNLHTKLGHRFANRYQTIPFTWFSYDPNTNLGLLQMSQPAEVNGEADFFAHDFALEIELNKVGKRNLQYCWVESEQ